MSIQWLKLNPDVPDYRAEWATMLPACLINVAPDRTRWQGLNQPVALFCANDVATFEETAA